MEEVEVAGWCTGPQGRVGAYVVGREGVDVAAYEGEDDCEEWCAQSCECAGLEACEEGGGRDAQQEEVEDVWEELRGCLVD